MLSYLVFDLSVAAQPPPSGNEADGAPRAAARLPPVAGYRLLSFFGLLCDQAGQVRGVRRATVLPGHDGATLPDEPALLARILEHLGEARCRVTYAGRELVLPVLELRALALGRALPELFDDLDEPGPGGHLDLWELLGDGRAAPPVGEELVTALAFPEWGAAAPPRDDTGGESLDALRERVARQYGLFLRLLHLRGSLDDAQLQAAAKSACERFRQADLPRPARALARFTAPRAPAPLATRLDGAGPGLLAFDIETVFDEEAGARLLGLPPDTPDLRYRLAAHLERARGRELSPPGGGTAVGGPAVGSHAGADAPGGDPAGGGGEAAPGPPPDFDYFFPPPLHRPVSLAMLYCDESFSRVEVDHLTLGRPTLAGAEVVSEEALLATFWALGRNKVIVTFNGRGFDLPVLIHRSLPYAVDSGWYFRGLRPGFAGDRQPESHRRHFDVRAFLKNGGRSPGALDVLARLLGLPGKFGIDGSQVAERVAQGQLDEVARYCLSDAVQTFCLGLHVRHLAGWIDDDQLARGVAAVGACVRSEPLLAELREVMAPYFERWARPGLGPLPGPGKT